MVTSASDARLDRLEHRTDRIGFTRLDEARRTVGQVLQGIVLIGVERLERQVALGEPLQTQRGIELGPFRAQHRDGVALFTDLRAQPQHPLGALGRFHLDAVDIGGGKHQNADHEEMDDAHASASPHHGVERRPSRQFAGRMDGSVGTRCRAKLGGTRARIGREFVVIGHDGPLGENGKARRAMRRSPAGAASRHPFWRAR